MFHSDWWEYPDIKVCSWADNILIFFKLQCNRICNRSEIHPIEINEKKKKKTYCIGLQGRDSVHQSLTEWGLIWMGLEKSNICHRREACCFTTRLSYDILIKKEKVKKYKKL